MGDDKIVVYSGNKGFKMGNTIYWAVYSEKFEENYIAVEDAELG